MPTWTKRKTGARNETEQLQRRGRWQNSATGKTGFQLTTKMAERNKFTDASSPDRPLCNRPHRSPDTSGNANTISRESQKGTTKMRFKYMVRTLQNAYGNTNRHECERSTYVRVTEQKQTTRAHALEWNRRVLRVVVGRTLTDRKGENKTVRGERAQKNNSYREETVYHGVVSVVEIFQVSTTVMSFATNTDQRIYVGQGRSQPFSWKRKRCCYGGAGMRFASIPDSWWRDATILSFTRCTRAFGQMPE